MSDRDQVPFTPKNKTEVNRDHDGRARTGGRVPPARNQNPFSQGPEIDPAKFSIRDRKKS